MPRRVKNPVRPPRKAAPKARKSAHARPRRAGVGTIVAAILLLAAIAAGGWYLAHHSRGSSSQGLRVAVSSLTSFIYDIFPASSPISQYSYEQRAEIDEFLDERRSLEPKTPPDPVFASNKSKNLLLLLVGGLNGSLDTLCAGSDPVMPTLHALAHAPGSVASASVIPQAQADNPADALLIVDTGLLPFSSRAFSRRYAQNLWPSLVKALPRHHTWLVAPDYPHEAHMPEFAAALGFDSLYTAAHAAAAGFHPDTLGIDRALTELACRTLRSGTNSFAATVMLPGLCHPLADERAAHAIPEVDLAGVVGPQRQYFLKARMLDSCIADIIATLRRHGLWQNTVLAICAASNINIAASEADAIDTTPAPTLFIAANTGATQFVPLTVAQIDVYPTLLQIMGLQHSPWLGLGLSILNPRCGGAVDNLGALHGHPSGGMEQYMQRAWSVSALMIRGNYFSRQQLSPAP